MSSAPSRTSRLLGGAFRGVAWTALLAVVAASAAGLAGLAWHAPGSAARAELTYAGDVALGARLDAAALELATIADNVEQLAEQAKTALEEVASMDPARVRAVITRGDVLAGAIDSRARALRDSLADLPGEEPDAVLLYSHATLARRAAILTAIEASLGLAAHWRTVGLRATDTSTLVGLITQHDGIVVDAAARGRDRDWKDARDRVDDALAVIETIEGLRARLIAADQDSVLDEWIDRTKAYDVALRNLYEQLRKSKGKVTVLVQSARREEQIAFQNLPPDRRTILVIISEVTRGGLTQAVLAIEDAHGRLDEALSLAAPEPTLGAPLATLDAPAP